MPWSPIHRVRGARICRAEQRRCLVFGNIMATIGEFPALNLGGIHLSMIMLKEKEAN